MPGEIIEHQAHAVGHAARSSSPDRRASCSTGDMLSDVLIPILDRRRPGQAGAYETALGPSWVVPPGTAGVLVPGHGAVAGGPEVAARLAADRAYIDALRQGGEPADARLGPDATYGRAWLPIHQSNLEQARGRIAAWRGQAIAPK